MKLRVHQDTLIGGKWTGVGVGDFDPITAANLIRIGVAEEYETKVIETIETKKSEPVEPSSVSQADPALPLPIAKRPRGRPRLSQSTTPGV